MNIVSPRVLQRATAKDPNAGYPDVQALLADTRDAMYGSNGKGYASLLDHMLFGSIAAKSSAAGEQILPLAIENPTKGLRAFQEADAANFFGRAALTKHLAARLAERGKYHRFLAVVGPSGSGKSSVVRAGLLPALRCGELPGAEGWFIAAMFPGTYLIEALETALLRVAVDVPTGLIEQLRAGEYGLARVVKQMLPAASAPRPTVQSHLVQS